MTFAFNRIDSLVRFSYQRHTLESDMLVLGFSLTNRDGNVMTSYDYIYVTLWSRSKKYKFFRSFCIWAVRTYVSKVLLCVTCMRIHTIFESLTVTWPQCSVHTLYFSNEKTSTLYQIWCYVLALSESKLTLLECRQHYTYKFKPVWKASWSLASSDPIDF